MLEQWFKCKIPFRLFLNTQARTSESFIYWITYWFTFTGSKVVGSPTGSAQRGQNRTKSPNRELNHFSWNQFNWFFLTLNHVWRISAESPNRITQLNHVWRIWAESPNWITNWIKREKKTKKRKKSSLQCRPLGNLIHVFGIWLKHWIHPNPAVSQSSVVASVNLIWLHKQRYNY